MIEKEKNGFGQEKKLSTLQSAAHIAKSLHEGESKKEIARKFDDDMQLVEMLSSFVYHNHWLEKKDDGELQLTEKGKRHVANQLRAIITTGAYRVWYSSSLNELQLVMIDAVA